MDLAHYIEVSCLYILVISISLIIFEPITKKWLSELAAAKEKLNKLNDSLTEKEGVLTAPAFFNSEKTELVSTKAVSKTRKPKIQDNVLNNILIDSGFITRFTLSKAVEHQKQYGGGIIQYLLHYRHIDENQLVQCYCSKFGVPYLPLGSYNVTADTIQIIPPDIAEKYWVVPVEKNGDMLTVVMMDPLDKNVIKELEDITGLKVIPFVGIISEIFEKLQANYKHVKASKLAHYPSFFIDTKTYIGRERRASIRYACKINIQFPLDGKYIQSQTIDVCRNGFGFKTTQSIPQDTILNLQIDLPKEFYPLPIAAVAQVARCIAKEDNVFEIGVKTLKIPKPDINRIIEYAVEHVENSLV